MMTLLSPLALLWLGSIPVLIWLWRHATSRRQRRVSSLVPFEHLLRRPPTRRKRLVVNLLFWLQLAALIIIALILSDAVFVGRQAKTILVLFDTSASMAASDGRSSPFQQAKQYLLARITRKGPAERLFLVSTAPINRLTPRPISDATQLRQIVQGVSVSNLAGNLSVAHRIGQALLGMRPEETLVLTDEPLPPGELDQGIELRTFGKPVANAAIIGVDANFSLCAEAEPQVLVNVQNFADVSQAVRLSLASSEAQATASQSLEPQGRALISLGVPRHLTGVFEVRLQAERDALAVDNRAFVALRGTGLIPVVVASEDPQLAATIGSWLDACPRIAWKSVHPLAGSPLQQLDETQAATLAQAQGPTEEILITDQADLAAQWPFGAILLAQRAANRGLSPMHLVVDAAHPISEYLEPIQTVTAGASPLPAGGQWGQPIIWGLVDGRKVPVARAASMHGRRIVNILFDPTADVGSTASIVVFLNSLRWLTGASSLSRSGEPLVVGPLEQGRVRVQRPDGAVELVAHGGGALHYESTEHAGLYRFLQDRITLERIVNFLDPVESNTMMRVSTWAADSAPILPSRAHEALDESLAGWLIGVVLALLLLEWVLYVRKGRT